MFHFTLYVFLILNGVSQAWGTVLNDGKVIDSDQLDDDAPILEDMAYWATDIIESLISNFTDDTGKLVLYLELQSSNFYTVDIRDEFYEALTKISPFDFGRFEEGVRKAFFINLYNLLTIDAILNLEELPQQTRKVSQFWRSYAYRIGPQSLNLDEIEHGILRGNAAHPDGTVFFEKSDPRAKWAVPLDKRIHAALNCGAKSCPIISSYSPAKLDAQLEEAMSRMCLDGIILEGDGSLTINSIFKWYSKDFGSSASEVLRWLSNCTSNKTMSQALLEAAKGDRSYSYDYNWALNGAHGILGSSHAVQIIVSLTAVTLVLLVQALHVM